VPDCHQPKLAKGIINSHSTAWLLASALILSACGDGSFTDAVPPIDVTGTTPSTDNSSGGGSSNAGGGGGSSGGDTNGGSGGDTSGSSGGDTSGSSGGDSNSGAGGDSGGDSGSGNPPDSGEATPTETGPVACSANASAMQARMLELLNAARAEARQCGSEYFAAAPPLTWDSKLEQASKAHSNDMATINFFSHTSSDGGTLATRADATEYKWSNLGENIAAGQSTATQAMNGWIDSPGHCRNLMNPNFTETGAACTEDSGSDYRVYWTNVFARER